MDIRIVKDKINVILVFEDNVIEKFQGELSKFNGKISDFKKLLTLILSNTF